MRLVLALLLLVAPASLAGCSLFRDEPAAAPTSTGAISATSMVAPQTTPTTTGPTTTSIPATSHVDADDAKLTFLARASEICDVMNRGNAELNQRFPEGSQPTPEQLAEGVNGTRALSETAVRDLRALPQPPGEELALGRLYAEVDEINVLLRRLAEALAKRDAFAVATVTSELDPKSQATNQHFIDYGLITCGQGHRGDATPA